MFFIIFHKKINAVDVHIGLRELKKPLKNPRGFYASLLQEIKNLLDGLIDSASFEDSLRFALAAFKK
jgi:hypothetical protein